MTTAINKSIKEYLYQNKLKMGALLSLIYLLIKVQIITY